MENVRKSAKSNKPESKKWVDTSDEEFYSCESSPNEASTKSAEKKSPPGIRLTAKERFQNLVDQLQFFKKLKIGKLDREKAATDAIQSQPSGCRGPGYVAQSQQNPVKVSNKRMNYVESFSGEGIGNIPNQTIPPSNAASLVNHGFSLYSYLGGVEAVRGPPRVLLTAIEKSKDLVDQFHSFDKLKRDKSKSDQGLEAAAAANRPQPCGSRGPSFVSRSQLENSFQSVSNKRLDHAQSFTGAGFGNILDQTIPPSNSAFGNSTSAWNVDLVEAVNFPQAFALLMQDYNEMCEDYRIIAPMCSRLTSDIDDFTVSCLMALSQLAIMCRSYLQMGSRMDTHCDRLREISTDAAIAIIRAEQLVESTFDTVQKINRICLSEGTSSATVYLPESERYLLETLNRDIRIVKDLLEYAMSRARDYFIIRDKLIFLLCGN